MIATILREVLKGLDYMHRHENIHRDVKVALPLMTAQISVPKSSA